MYGRKEVAAVKETFWTAFGQYMLPVPPAGGGKVNWVNYKTGEKNVSFKMEAGQAGASISISLTHRDPAQRESFFGKLLPLQDELHTILSEPWTWAKETTDEHGRSISRIYKELKGVNIMNKEDWPKLISFFKPRIMALDSFWEIYREVLL